MLEVADLVKHYGPVKAVDGLSFSVKPGEVFGLLGHNGAGKTTTIRLLNGVLRPTSGTARVFGLCPMKDGITVRRRSGVLTETPSLEERLTARQNLRYYADLYGVEASQVPGRIEALLQTFELSEVGDGRVGGFSKGMKQRLALCRALLHQPELLYLDEPTAGLDPVAARRVIALIKEQSRVGGRTVVICTHNLGEAEQICDRVAVLERGKLLAIGTSAELARAYQHSAQVVIEVALEAVEQALACARGFEGVEVRAENGQISLTGLSRQRIPELIAALAKLEVSIYRVEPQEASLEDIYFALHKREARTPEPATTQEGQEVKA
jgi:ABC-2 type transport system ATP-binding protein